MSGVRDPHDSIARRLQSDPARSRHDRRGQPRGAVPRGASRAGIDLLTALGASAATVGNIGPGLGGVGPVENYGWMSGPALGILSFLMLVGRLEIFTVLILFNPYVWRRRVLPGAGGFAALPGEGTAGTGRKAVGKHPG